MKENYLPQWVWLRKCTQIEKIYSIILSYHCLKPQSFNIYICVSTKLLINLFIDVIKVSIYFFLTPIGLSIAREKLCEYHYRLFYINSCYPSLVVLSEIIDNALIFHQSSLLGESFKVPMLKIFHFSQGAQAFYFNRWPLLSAFFEGKGTFHMNYFGSQWSNFKNSLYFYLSFF